MNNLMALPMNILIINYSGNVGKSTLANYCFSENLPNHNLLLVETINSTPVNYGEKISAHDFSKIFDGMFESEYGSIVDVGSSNAESFFFKMTEEWIGSHEFFKYFIIPVTPSVKQQDDADELVRGLLAQGISPSRIKLILNMVDPRKDLQLQFETLKTHDTLGNLGINSLTDLPVIRYFDFFNTIANSGIPFEFIRNDTRNHQLEMMKLMRNPDNLSAEELKKERAKLSVHTLSRQGYLGYTNNLNSVFAMLKLEPDYVTSDTVDTPNAENASKPKKG